MSLWSDYIAELSGGTRRFIEKDWGFVSYSYPSWAQDSIFVEDMYIVPAERSSGRGSDLLEEVCEIGRLAGKRFVLANVEIDTEICVGALRAQLAVGLVPIGANNGKIMLRRPL